MDTKLSAYIEKNKVVPFAPLFTEAQIREAIHELATTGKTKGQQLFQRFYENDTELFRTFRALNGDPKNVKKAEFHTIGEQVIGKVRYLEQILTDKMLKRDTDKTITAFYDHVRLFFPLYDQIGVE